MVLHSLEEIAGAILGFKIIQPYQGRGRGIAKAKQANYAVLRLDPRRCGSLSARAHFSGEVATSQAHQMVDGAVQSLQGPRP